MADRHGLSTASTKNHLEGVFSYSDAAVKKLAEGRVTAPNTITFVDDDDSLASYGEDLVLRAAVPITAGADATYTITGTNASGGTPLTGTAVMPHHVPQGQSIDVTPSVPSAKFATVTAIAVSGGAAGDKVEILTVPNVDSLGASQWNLLKYVDSMDINTGPYLRPIPERYDPSDHKKRQRQENKTTVTQRYQNNVDGLAKIEGREVTLLLQVEDDGGGTYTETMIFSQFDASTPLSIPKDGDITVKSEGTFSRRIIFS